MPKRSSLMGHNAWSAVVLLGACACAAPEDVEYAPPAGGGGVTGSAGETSGTAGTDVAGTSTAGGSAGEGGSSGSAGASGGSVGTSGSAGKGGSAGTSSIAGGGGNGGSGGTSGAGGASGSASGGASGSASGGAGNGGSGGSAMAFDLPFLDDFEDGDASGWMSVDDEGATIGGWSVVSDGSSVFKQGTASSDPSWSIGGNVAWTDQIVEVKLKFDDVPDESAAALLAARFRSFDAYYYLELRGDGGIKIRKRVDGSTGDVTRYDPDAPLAGGTWYTVGIGAVGSTLTAYFNGVPVATGTDSDVTAGGIGIGTTEEAIVSFDDVSVTAP